MLWFWFVTCSETALSKGQNAPSAVTVALGQIGLMCQNAFNVLLRTCKGGHRKRFTKGMLRKLVHATGADAPLEKVAGFVKDGKAALATVITGGDSTPLATEPSSLSGPGAF